jgi:hypothetical protein
VDGFGAKTDRSEIGEIQVAGEDLATSFSDLGSAAESRYCLARPSETCLCSPARTIAGTVTGMVPEMWVPHRQPPGHVRSACRTADRTARFRPGTAPYRFAALILPGDGPTRAVLLYGTGIGAISARRVEVTVEPAHTSVNVGCSPCSRRRDAVLALVACGR